MVDLGSRLCIVLPQLSTLQTRLQQEKWLVSVRANREACSALTPDVIDKLLAEAEAILPHHRIEVERAALHKLKRRTFSHIWIKDLILVIF